jgi:choline dehydrogenase-like flavoprotein
MLGGSSGKNQMALNRATTTEYDAWSFYSEANNWTWDGLLPFFKATERMYSRDPFASFSQGLSDLGADLYGFVGPISASMNEIYSAEIPSYVRTLNKLGINTIVQPVSLRLWFHLGCQD